MEDDVVGRLFGPQPVVSAGSVTVGMVSRVTFFAQAGKAAGQPESLLAESSPWSTVSARVATSPIFK